jgi:PAS domain S-box-containing protein
MASSSSSQHSRADPSPTPLNPTPPRLQAKAGKLGWQVSRLAISGGLVAGLVVACSRVPHIDHALVDLLMLFAVYQLARTWGQSEALTGAWAGAATFDYFILGPLGFPFPRPQYGVALAAFLAIAFLTTQLAGRSKLLLEERASLLDLSLEPLCIRARSGNFRLVNPAMEALLGWQAEELCSHSFLEYIHPDDRARTEAAFRDLSDRPAIEFEDRYRTKNGDWLWLHWKIAPHSSSASEVLAAARNITEERRAEEQLQDLAAQLVTAQEEERRRIARDLHDDVTQKLANLGIELGLLKRAPAWADALEVQTKVSRFQTQILHLSEDLRTLSHSLHPSILEHSDLSATLEMLCQEFTNKHGIAANFTARSVPRGMDRTVALTLYRFAQEALRNTARHSGASSASVVLVGQAEEHLSLYVIDDGCGFDVEEKRKTGVGLGLVSIEERARELGGSVAIDSMPGAGTRLNVEVPLWGRSPAGLRKIEAGKGPAQSPNQS